MIERLLTPGSIPELVMRRCVLGKTLYAICRSGQAVYSLWWPNVMKNVPTEP